MLDCAARTGAGNVRCWMGRQLFASGGATRRKWQFAEQWLDCRIAARSSKSTTFSFNRQGTLGRLGRSCNA
eukprot:6320226-Pyramimonas_sp.AAC.1